MNEIAEKKLRIDGFLNDNHLDALYLCQVSNFAWMTAGLEPVVMLSSDRAEAGLLITPDKCFVICNNIEYPRLRDEDRLSEQGYEFYVTPWHHGLPMFHDLVKDKRWASDWPLPGVPDLSSDIARLRFQLTPAEVERYRWVGLHTAKALESTAQNVRPGMSEMQIAGLISSKALDIGITPTLLLVGTDERIFHFRHPIPTMKPLERYAMLVICGRRWGLVASATRLVHFGPLPDELKQKQIACAYVDATFNAATMVGTKVSDIFQRAAQAYTEVGFPEEWMKHNQGGSAGYMSRDYEGTPDCDEVVLEEQAFAWNPSITGIKSEDTMIVHSNGSEFITVTGEWPSLNVHMDNQRPSEDSSTVANQDWERPEILNYD